MTAKISIVSLAVLLFVSGCATAPSGRTPQGRIAACNANVCHVAIAVSDCQVTATPPILEVTQQNIEIHWDIDKASAGYTFDVRGIVVERDDKGEFSGGKVAENGQKYILHDKNSFSSIYKYDIRVLNNGVACPVVDPWIYNN